MNDGIAGRQFVGVDLHLHRSVIVRVDGRGREVDCVRIDNDAAGLVAEVAKAARHARVAVEATYGWYWAVDALRAAGVVGGGPDVPSASWHRWSPSRWVRERGEVAHRPHRGHEQHQEAEHGAADGGNRAAAPGRSRHHEREREQSLDGVYHSLTVDEPPSAIDSPTRSRSPRSFESCGWDSSAATASGSNPLAISQMPRENSKTATGRADSPARPPCWSIAFEKYGEVADDGQWPSDDADHGQALRH
jgi:hypothetical protein